MAWDLLREMRGDSHLERGRSLVRSNQEPCWSGLQQGQAFGAAEQRAVGHEEFSAWELPVLFSSVGKTELLGYNTLDRASVMLGDVFSKVSFWE